MPPRASVVIPIFQRTGLVRACLASLHQAGLDGVEVVLVDNGSAEPAMPALLDAAEEWARVRRNPVNLGFATACNQGARMATAPLVVFLNTDTEVRAGWLEPLVDALDDRAVGVAGSRLLYGDGRVQHAGMALMRGCRPVHLHRGAPGDHPAVTRTRDLALLTGACLAVRRDVFAAAGGFDASYRNGFEDVDLCLRLARDGLVARYRGDSVVVHHEGRSPGRRDHEERNALLLRSRWDGWPDDWSALLAEDGVTETRPAQVLWTGPLFDGGAAAAAGLAAITALERAGIAVAAVERDAGPVAVGAGPACPVEILAALNRRADTGAPLARIVHGTPGGVGDVAVVGPDGSGPRGLRGARAVVAIGGAAANAAMSAGVDPLRLAVVEDPSDGFVEALESVSGSMAAVGHTIGWWGPILGRSGYASAGRALVGAARARGWTVRITPADRDETDDPALHVHPGPVEVAPDLWVVHHPPVVADGYRVWEHVASQVGAPFVGAVCFETEGLPDGWVEACELPREVWVPTAFNVRTFSEAGVDPERIHAVPYPVDCDIFCPAPAARRPDGAFTFTSVFEWTWRKGWDVLLSAYVEEFSPGDDVALRILTYRGTGTSGGGSVAEQAAAHILAMGRDPGDVADIDLLLHPLTLGQVVDLYRTAGAFVLPSRGEGAGMPVLEAMACGTPVIATAWGGHEELMTEEWAYPVAVEGLVETRADLVADNPIYRGLRVAEPSVASLRRQMRAVYEDREEAAARAAGGLRVVRERFGIAAAAAAIDARLRALLAPAGRGRARV